MAKKNGERQLLVFGYVLPLICFFLSWRQYVKHGFTVWVEALIIAGIIVVAMALFMRSWLKVLFKYWMKVAQVIGMIINIFILTIFYFVVITPISIFLRLMGKDFMNLRNQGQFVSYWIKRENKKEDYTQQF